MSPVRLNLSISTNCFALLSWQTLRRLPTLAFEFRSASRLPRLRAATIQPRSARSGVPAQKLQTQQDRSAVAAASPRNTGRLRTGAQRSLTAILLLSALLDGAVARQGSRWGASQNVHDWFATLMQPDNPRVPCCGEADAYWADSYEVDEDQYVAIITDDRGEGYDEYVGRITREPGSKFPVPNRKIKWNSGNPTGHGIVFLSSQGSVICYLPPGGV